MSRPPAAPASRNISACNLQAVSHVGCRLAVASRANTSRPRTPGLDAGLFPSSAKNVSRSAVDGALPPRAVIEALGSIVILTPPLGVGPWDLWDLAYKFARDSPDKTYGTTGRGPRSPTVPHLSRSTSEFNRPS